MNILFELHQARMSCPDEVIRETLSATNGRLRRLLTALVEAPTDDALRDLTGAWTHARRLLAGVARPDEDDPNGGSAEPTRLAA